MTTHTLSGSMPSRLDIWPAQLEAGLPVSPTRTVPLPSEPTVPRSGTTDCQIDFSYPCTEGGTADRLGGGDNSSHSGDCCCNLHPATPWHSKISGQLVANGQHQQLLSGLEGVPTNISETASQAAIAGQGLSSRRGWSAASDGRFSQADSDSRGQVPHLQGLLPPPSSTRSTASAQAGAALGVGTVIATRYCI